jgi:hypothetical protein
MGRAMDELLALEPTPCREWTWWDHLVFRLAGRVSRRVFVDRMTKAAIDERRVRTLARLAAHELPPPR